MIIEDKYKKEIVNMVDNLVGFANDIKYSVKNCKVDENGFRFNEIKDNLDNLSKTYTILYKDLNAVLYE